MNQIAFGTPAKCSACGSEIVWAVTAKGERMPVDPEPIVGGNLILDLSGSGATARVQTAAEKAEAAAAGHVLGTRYVSHFATCPAAARFRKPKTPAEPKAKQ